MNENKYLVAHCKVNQVNFMKHRLFFVAAISWLSIGIFLMNRGIGFLLQPSSQANFSSLFHTIAGAVDTPLHAALVLVIMGLVVGTFKARVIFRKIVARNKARIQRIPPEKAFFFRAFSTKDYLIMCCMMALGMVMRPLGVPEDVRGFILVAVGAALLQGGVFYLTSECVAVEE